MSASQDNIGPLLRNKLGLTDPGLFDTAERRFVVQRICEGIPTGRFDLAHFQAIHAHVYQDLYEWAGQVRTVDVDSDAFRHFTPAAAAKIEPDMAAIHGELIAKNLLAGLSPGDFARESALLIADISYVHVFEDGNETAELLYLQQLAEQAGHPIDLALIPAEPWIEALEASAHGDAEPCAALIAAALR